MEHLKLLLFLNLKALNQVDVVPKSLVYHLVKFFSFWSQYEKLFQERE
jgi:hypothetical protein